MEERKKEVENESKNEVDKKKLLILIIIIAVLGVVLALVVPTLIDKDAEKELLEDGKVVDVQDETDNTENNDDQNVEKLTKDSAVVKKLFAIYSEVENGVYSILAEHDLVSVSSKKSLAALVLKREGKNVEKTCGSLNAVYTHDGYFCDPYNLTFDGNGEIDYAKYPSKIQNSKVVTYSASELKAKYLELFGQNAEYKEEGFDLTNYPDSYAYYDSVNALYAHFAGGGGGIGIDATQILDSIEQNGTSLKLNTTIQLEDEDKTKLSVTYSFKYETATGNYIFVSRVEK